MTKPKPFSTDEIHARIDALFSQGEALQPAARADIVALGSAATPKLVEILKDRALWDDQAKGEGFAPIHAAEILGEIGDPAALDPLYATFRKVDPDAILDDAVTDAIRAFGQAAIPAGVRALNSWEDPFLADIAYLFSELNTAPFHNFDAPESDDNSDPKEHDEKLHRKALQVLLKFFLKHPIAGAELLADFGDPIAVDALTVALDRYIASAEGETKYRRPVFALAKAIEQLGGELSRTQAMEVELLKANRTRSEEAIDKLHAKPTPDDSETVQKDRHIGRNDPCWCGSGRKYKRCHLAEDRADA